MGISIFQQNAHHANLINIPSIVVSTPTYLLKIRLHKIITIFVSCTNGKRIILRHKFVNVTSENMAAKHCRRHSLSLRAQQQSGSQRSTGSARSTPHIAEGRDFMVCCAGIPKKFSCRPVGLLEISLVVLLTSPKKSFYKNRHSARVLVKHHNLFVKHIIASALG